MHTFYNIQGKTLSRVGVGEVPDLFSRPFHSLNATIQKSFGKERNASLSFRVNNILNDDIETFFESHEAADQVSSLRSPGRRFTFTFRYSLF